MKSPTPDNEGTSDTPRVYTREDLEKAVDGFLKIPQIESTFINGPMYGLDEESGNTYRLLNPRLKSSFGEVCPELTIEFDGVELVSDDLNVYTIPIDLRYMDGINKDEA